MTWYLYRFTAGEPESNFELEEEEDSEEEEQPEQK